MTSRLLFCLALAGPLSAQDGGQLFALHCSACHGADGKGATGGTFPPLAGSAWLTGDGERAIKVVLNGIGGPIDVRSKTYNLEMPPQGTTLSDDQISAILSFVRSSWGNNEAPVTTDQVKSVRAAIANRPEAWTAAEILKLHPLPPEKPALKDLISQTYLGDWQQIPDFKTLKPQSGEEEPSGLITLKNPPRNDNFAITWQGKLEVPEAGTYQFLLDADDAANLIINGHAIASVKGIGVLNGSRAKKGAIKLEKGDQDFRLEFLQYKQRKGITLGWMLTGEKNWNWLTEEKSITTSAWPSIPIQPTADRAVIYRNFIAGSSPRAIGVGFPGGLNLAYSADNMTADLIWTGKFMDGGHHWTSRGIGAEPPAGGMVINLPHDRFVPADARFKGYRLDPAGNPTFTVQMGERVLSDSWHPENQALVRKLTLQGGGPDLEIPLTAHSTDKFPTIQIDDAKPHPFSGKESIKLTPQKSTAIITYRWK